MENRRMKQQIKGKNSLPLNPFLFAFYLMRIRSFGFWAFTPNPSAQNPKQKNKFMIIDKKPVKMKLNEKYFLNSLLPVAPRCALTSLRYARGV